MSKGYHSASMTALACAIALVPAVAAAQTQAQSAEPAPAADAGLGDIVVTANRREESGQRVPVAVTALSAEGLRDQGIASSQDLMGKVPSVVVGPNSTQRSAEAVAIRGQGQTALAAPGVVKGSVAKIVKLEHAWRRLDGRNDDGFQVAPFPG
jgi:iron complex outermembrane recepter protein